MPDNWTFVAVAYGLTGLVLGLYWRHLVRKEKELRQIKPSRSVTGVAEHNHEPSRTGHPRPKQDAKSSLQQ
jgi:hypothetical protein